MVNELSLNQTVQAEIGEFNRLFVDGEEITSSGGGGGNNDCDCAQIEADIEALQQGLAQAQRDINDLEDSLSTTRQNLQNRIRDVEQDIANNVKPAIEFNATRIDNNNDLINQNSSFIQSNTFNIQTNSSAINGLRRDVDFNEAKNFEQDERLNALEATTFDSSIVDDLSTTVQALQTRIGTLERLIGLLTNNNTNDTAIEHRISRIEKAITALKAIHDSKKSIYSIPLDW